MLKKLLNKLQQWLMRLLSEPEIATMKVNLSQEYNSLGLMVLVDNLQPQRIIEEKFFIKFDTLLQPKQFIKLIRKNKINNTNYRLVEVILNRYKSNIGLNYKQFSQGVWQLDIKQFKKVCKMYDVVILLDNKGENNG